MSSLSDTPKLFFVSFALLCLGGLFLLIGFATPHWYESSSWHDGSLIYGYIGLWRICAYSALAGGIICHPTTALTGTFTAIQALSCLALVSVAGSGLAAIAFIPMKTRQKTLAMISAVLSMGAAGCNGVAVFLFGISTTASYYSLPYSTLANLGYSFILAAVAAVIIVVASILSFVLACNMRPANALPSSGVVHYNHGNVQYAGAQYQPQAAPGYPQTYPNTMAGQYAAPGQYPEGGAPSGGQPGVHQAGVNKY